MLRSIDIHAFLGVLAEVVKAFRREVFWDWAAGGGESSGLMSALSIRLRPHVSGNPGFTG